jgi:hypothetical protein
VVATKKPFEITGQYGKISISSVYIIAFSFEEALSKFRKEYKEQADNIKGINILNYFYGAPIVE